MNKVVLFFIVGFLSVVHVHFSIDTQDNLLNPLSMIILVNSRVLYLSEHDSFIYGGVFIQGIVTIGLAWRLLKWKKYHIWITAITLCFPLISLLGSSWGMKLQNTEDMTTYYQDVYGTERTGMFRDAILFSITQIMLLLFYSMISFCLTTVEKYLWMKKVLT